MTLALQTFSHQTHQHLPAPLQAYLEISLKNQRQFVQNKFAYCNWIIEHEFSPMALLCVDGRASDFSTNGLGLLPGTCHVIRSPGLKRCRFRNATYARRIQRTKHRIEHVRLENSVYKKRPLCFVVAHHSAGHSDHGCAACNSDVELAIRYMKESAAELRWYLNEGVVVEALLDTDRDSLKLFGKTESVDLDIYLQEQKNECDIEGAVRQDLLRLFQGQQNSIPRWSNFLNEATQLLAANVRYARSTEGRPFESCLHREQMIVIGGPLETTNRDAAFLIEKEDSAYMIEDLEIGLPIVARNVWQQVLNQHSTDTHVPILVSLDYEEPSDQRLISEVALGLIDMLRARLGDVGSFLADRFANELWWQQAPADFKSEMIRKRGNLFWQAAVYEQRVRELHLIDNR